MITRSEIIIIIRIVAESSADGIQDPYLDTLNLTTSDHLNIYNNAIIGLPENNRYDLISSKWTIFYQQFEDTVSTFGFKVAAQIVSTTDLNHALTDIKNII